MLRRCVKCNNRIVKKTPERPWRQAPLYSVIPPQSPTEDADINTGCDVVYSLLKKNIYFCFTFLTFVRTNRFFLHICHLRIIPTANTLPETFRPDGCDPVSMI